ncbi:MAG: hypothetical protein DWQ01_06620 [Planctomycetota bacterium]|nr:MAG: hypothetical protein DWQ01_06620 [Planctomycetota bacterium]
MSGNAPSSPDQTPGPSETPEPEQLLEHHLPSLLVFLRLRAGRLLRAKEWSMDLAQSVCREALESFDDFEYRGERAFREWLYTVASHKILERVRFYQRGKRDVRKEVQPVDQGGLVDLVNVYRSHLPSPSRDASAREEIERLEDAFDRLKPEEREVILLSRFAGLTHAEIGRRQNRSEEASRKLLSRGLLRLAKLLEA